VARANSPESADDAFDHQSPAIDDHKHQDFNGQGNGGGWYQLAEVNGLAGNAALSEGQVLLIPTGAIKNTHNAATFTPYDPNEIIGNTSPTAAKPPKKNKCGGFGQILLIVIAIVVTIYTAGAAAAALSPAISGIGAGIGAVMGGTLVTTAGASVAIASAAIGAAAGSDRIERALCCSHPSQGGSRC
jgi:hypothetical protein